MSGTGSGTARGAGEAVIAAGTGIALTSSHESGGRATAIQDAMAAAAAQCAEEGITDPAVIRARMLEAREAVMSQ